MSIAVPILTLFPPYFVSHRLGMTGTICCLTVSTSGVKLHQEEFFTELFLGFH